MRQGFSSVQMGRRDAADFSPSLPSGESKANRSERMLRARAMARCGGKGLGCEQMDDQGAPNGLDVSGRQCPAFTRTGPPSCRRIWLREQLTDDMTPGRVGWRSHRRSVPDRSGNADFDLLVGESWLSVGNPE
jgi:hypothetical protein